MTELRTSEDGWDCIPQLKQASDCLEDVSSDKYEIDNCVRYSELEDLVTNLKEKLFQAIEYLNEIDLDTKIIEIDDEE